MKFDFASSSTTWAALSKCTLACRLFTSLTQETPNRRQEANLGPGPISCVTLESTEEMSSTERTQSPAAAPRRFLRLLSIFSIRRKHHRELLKQPQSHAGKELEFSRTTNLLALPGELRIMIYQLVLITDQTLERPTQPGIT